MRRERKKTNQNGAISSFGWIQSNPTRGTNSKIDSVLGTQGREGGVSGIARRGGSATSELLLI
jgi:hypothetical protein